MKYFLLVLIAFFSGGCSTDTYNIDIVYQDGTKESIRIKSNGVPHLNDGCLIFGAENDFNHAIRCGIRSFRYNKEKTEAE